MHAKFNTNVVKTNKNSTNEKHCVHIFIKVFRVQKGIGPFEKRVHDVDIYPKFTLISNQAYQQGFALLAYEGKTT